MTQLLLTDAMAARDRECAHGVGKFCRERETTVTDRRQAVGVAMRAVEQTADPHTEAAIRPLQARRHNVPSLFQGQGSVVSLKSYPCE
jgi:hypothetical protein